MVLPYTGGPDYGLSRYVVGGGNPDPFYSVDRQQSYSMLDGLGRVLVHDDFRNGLARWSLLTVGTGIAPAIATTQGRVFNPPQSVKLDASLALNDASRVYGVFHYQRVQRFGLECRWSLFQGTLRIEQFIAYGLPGGNQYQGIVRYDPVDNLIKVIHNGGTANIAIFDDLQMGSAAFVGIKVVIDLATLKYVRLVVGGNAYDLSAYSLFVAAGSKDNQLEVRMTAVKSDAALTTDPPYLGSVTVTVDEP